MITDPTVNVGMGNVCNVGYPDNCAFVSYTIILIESLLGAV